MSGITTTLAVALGLYLLLALFMFGCQRSFLYFPDKSNPDIGDAGVEGLMAVRLESEPGLEVEHWYRPPAAEDGPVLVVFHGNAGHIGHRVPKYRPLLDAGFGLFLAEYRGYGGNPGKPDEAGLTADARGRASSTAQIVALWRMRSAGWPAANRPVASSISQAIVRRHIVPTRRAWACRP